LLEKNANRQLSDLGAAKFFDFHFKHQVQSSSQCLLFVLEIAFINFVSIQGEFLLTIENCLLKKHYELPYSLNIVCFTQFVRKGLPDLSASVLRLEVSGIIGRQSVTPLLDCAFFLVLMAATMLLH
jgi:hypothetical protein